MRYLNSAFFALFFLVTLNNQAFAGAITGVPSAAATRYDVTVTKVELCRSTACTNPFTLGSKTKVFDIAAAAVGSDVGTYISLKDIPLWQTWTHVRVTLSTAFTIKGEGTAAPGCMTDGSTSAGRGAWAQPAATVAGTSTASVLHLPNQALITALPGMGAFTYSTYGITQVDNATSFTMTVAMTTPYTCKGVMPRIEVKFNTSEGFGYIDANASGTCNAGDAMFPHPPTITITASDP